MRRLLPFYVTVAVSLLGVVPLVGQGQGQGPGVQRPLPEVSQAVHHDTSRPLRDLPSRPMISTRPDFEVLRPGGEFQSSPDSALQTVALAPMAATAGTTFEGIGDGEYSFNVQYAPPDTVGEMGATQYVQWVNVSFAVFDKATHALVGGFPKAGNTIWSGFGGDCEARNDGDPIVQYDQLANRWILTQFALRSGNYLQCVAVSTTSDATGTYHRYSFPYTDFPDYPKLSVWPDAYYITFNMFRNGATFNGAVMCAYDRAQMLVGGNASQQCFRTSKSYHSLLPADLEGQTLPPQGTPNYLLNRSGSSTLNLWKFHVNWSNPANTTLDGPTAIPVAGYSLACGGGTCIPQKGTSNQLDSLGDRLMYRLSYRNLGSQEIMVVNHSVTAGSATGIRWYELDVTGGTPSVLQQGTYAPDGSYRWMGSIATDQTGNIALGYSLSSSTTYPAIRFAGREADSILAPGELSSDTDLWDGTGSQTSTLHRWGDYSTLSLDPADDCTFWYTTEYLQTNGSFNWNTKISSFKFSSCGSTTTSPDFALSASPGSLTVTQGNSTTSGITVSALNGFTGIVGFSASGLPSGASASFNPTSITTSGTSTMTVDTGTAVPGTYTITVTGTSGSTSHSVDVSLTIESSQPATGDFSISASPGTRNVRGGSNATYTVSISPTGGFSDDVGLGVSGAPGGSTVSWSPNPITGGSGSSTLTVTTSGVASGTYVLTITGTPSGGGAAHSTTVNLRVR